VRDRGGRQGRDDQAWSRTPDDGEITMLGLDCSVGSGVVLAAGSRLEPGTTA
jgi:hypothetical protein